MVVFVFVIVVVITVAAAGELSVLAYL